MDSIRYKFLILISFMFAAITIMAGNFGQELNKLTISFDSLSTDQGKIMVLVKDQNNKDIAKLVLPIHNKSASAILFLPNGNYAVVAYHDINQNEDLDTNIVGIPSEPYGFSNNARGLMGEPDLEDQLVEVESDTKITFDLK